MLSIRRYKSKKVSVQFVVIVLPLRLRPEQAIPELVRTTTTTRSNHEEYSVVYAIAD